MSGVTESILPAVSLSDIALAAVAGMCARADSTNSEARSLMQIAAAVQANGRSLPDAMRIALREPARPDAKLLWLAARTKLTPWELLTIALAASVEDQAVVGRMLAFAQAPFGGSRPTLALLSQAFAPIFGGKVPVIPELLNGIAVRSGLLAVLNEGLPLPERSVQVPAPLCMALAGYDSALAGTAVALESTKQVPLPASIAALAHQHATALESEPHRALIVRTGSEAEGRSVAQAVAASLKKRPAFLKADVVPGLGPWLVLLDLLPVFSLELAPGERRRLAEITGYEGPALVITGPDGSVESPHGAAASWTLPVPPLTERRELWLSALGPGSTDRSTQDLAEVLARNYRHSAGRIAHLGRLARHHASLADRGEPLQDDIVEAAWTGEAGGLDALAHPLRSHVGDDALVANADLRAALEGLVLRCRVREDLASGLGASTTTRYRAGVRALFTGPSGTGKTLAADWLATRLGLPLYRVDLASVTSKYIGETEKNLSQLLARAEQADVILLFDEADSLFGKRTDVSDANDRFANAQTNYLLQRIENYDGIVLLTSNSQARFDDAFARRLDFVIEFPLPGPEERRALWQSHLGTAVTLPPAELNRLAVLLDLSGGHIRNIVLSAAVRARDAQRPIAFGDLLAGLDAEFRKLGRQVPLEVRSSR